MFFFNQHLSYNSVLIVFRRSVRYVVAPTLFLVGASQCLRKANERRHQPSCVPSLMLASEFRLDVVLAVCQEYRELDSCGTPFSLSLTLSSGGRGSERGKRCERKTKNERWVFSSSRDCEIYPDELSIVDYNSPILFTPFRCMEIYLRIDCSELKIFETF